VPRSSAREARPEVAREWLSTGVWAIERVTPEDEDDAREIILTPRRQTIFVHRRDEHCVDEAPEDPARAVAVSIALFPVRNRARLV